MTKNEQPLHKTPIQELGKSIFPTFQVDVPMPSGTPVPPHVVVPEAPPSAGTAPTSTTSAPTKESGK